MKILPALSLVAALFLGASHVVAQPFTLTDKPWRGTPIAPDKVTDKTPGPDYPFSLRWDAGKPGTNVIFFNFTSRDFSGYNTLSFWVYAEKATFATIQVVFNSPTIGEQDVFESDFSVDTEGKWSKYTMSLDRFKKSREPAGWDQITAIQFCTHRHGNLPVEGTVLYFSGMQLELSP
ncbi:MAG: hypothetical protein H7067_02305 [Burkholderiales bacterium]|nr:hypothetical protein [Opitutaceae bacterium]